MTTEIKAGDPAPHFDMAAATTDQGGGGRVTLADFKGKALVLYFYPKDDTSGCTTEAKGFAEAAEAFARAGAAVVGVSKDSVASHARFRAKYDLNFPLGSDADGTVVEAYGVWVEKTLYGRKYMGVERSTFLIDAGLIDAGLIDAGGVVRRVWRKVKVAGHVAEVLAAVQAL